MFLIAILIAIACLQLGGGNNPLHQDAWFEKWRAFWSNIGPLKGFRGLSLAIAIALPSLGVALLSFAVRDSLILWTSFSSILLLYCLGRGEFTENFKGYLSAVKAEDTDLAKVMLARLGHERSDIGERVDWGMLNGVVLEQSGYRSFERLFVVIFWFVLFGPAGALVYRLSQIAVDRETNKMLERWLWAIEWPVVRVFALSFAITGSFVGCIERAQALLKCFSTPSRVVIREAILGALAITHTPFEEGVKISARELDETYKLLSRTLSLWVFVIAVLSIF